jgi:hypothetical protein
MCAFVKGVDEDVDAPAGACRNASGFSHALTTPTTSETNESTQGQGAQAKRAGFGNDGQRLADRVEF